MKTARSWPPALLAALLTATPAVAAALAAAPDGTVAPTPPTAVKSGTAGSTTPTKPTSASTTAAPGAQTAAPAKPTPAAAAKPGSQATPAAKPGSTAPAAAKPGAPAPIAAKPGAPAPIAAKPGAPAPATAKPATATQPVAGQPKGAAPTLPSATGAASPSMDPATNHLTLAQATLGIKGLGALFATIEIAAPAKPVQALHCELYSDQAPLTVANFIGLARGLRPWKDPKLGQWVKRPLYDGNRLHRVVPELLIQGGDPSCSVDVGCRGAAGLGDPGYSIGDEIRPELRFDRGGRLAMSNRGPGTGGSQFFITEREAPWLTGGHTIFGQCDGAELISQLAHVEAGSRDQPKVPLIIKRVIFSRKVK